MGNVVNLFNKSTEAVRDIETSFKLCDGKIDKIDLAIEAYDTLMTADFGEVDERNATSKAWDLAAFYKLGEFKLMTAKRMNRAAEKMYTLKIREKVRGRVI